MNNQKALDLLSMRSILFKKIKLNSLPLDLHGLTDNRYCVIRGKTLQTHHFI